MSNRLDLEKRARTSPSSPPPNQLKRDSQHQRRKTRQPPNFRQHAGHIAVAQQHFEQTFHAPSS